MLNACGQPCEVQLIARCQEYTLQISRNLTPLHAIPRNFTGACAGGAGKAEGVLARQSPATRRLAELFSRRGGQIELSGLAEFEKDVQQPATGVLQLLRFTF